MQDADEPVGDDGDQAGDDDELRRLDYTLRFLAWSVGGGLLDPVDHVRLRKRLERRWIDLTAPGPHPGARPPSWTRPVEAAAPGEPEDADEPWEAAPRIRWARGAGAERGPGAPGAEPAPPGLGHRLGAGVAPPAPGRPAAPATVPAVPHADAGWLERAKVAIAGEVGLHGLAYLGVLLVFAGTLGLVLFAFGGVNPALRPVAEAAIPLVLFGSAWLLGRWPSEQASAMPSAARRPRARAGRLAPASLELLGAALTPVALFAALVDGVPLPPDLPSGPALTTTWCALAVATAAVYALLARRPAPQAVRPVGYLAAPMLWAAAGVAAGPLAGSPSSWQLAVVALAVAVTAGAAASRPGPLSRAVMVATVPGAVCALALVLALGPRSGWPVGAIVMAGAATLASLELAGRGLGASVGTGSVRAIAAGAQGLVLLAVDLALVPGLGAAPAGAAGAVAFLALADWHGRAEGRAPWPRWPAAIVGLDLAGCALGVALASAAGADPRPGALAWLAAAVWFQARRARPLPGLRGPRALALVVAGAVLVPMGAVVALVRLLPPGWGLLVAALVAAVLAVGALAWPADRFQRWFAPALGAVALTPTFVTGSGPAPVRAATGLAAALAFAIPPTRAGLRAWLAGPAACWTLALTLDLVHFPDRWRAVAFALPALGAIAGALAAAHPVAPPAVTIGPPPGEGPPSTPARVVAAPVPPARAGGRGAGPEPAPTTGPGAGHVALAGHTVATLAALASAPGAPRLVALALWVAGWVAATAAAEAGRAPLVALAEALLARVPPLPPVPTGAQRAAPARPPVRWRVARVGPLPGGAGGEGNGGRPTAPAPGPRAGWRDDPPPGWRSARVAAEGPAGEVRPLTPAEEWRAARLAVAAADAEAARARAVALARAVWLDPARVVALVRAAPAALAATGVGVLVAAAAGGSPWRGTLVGAVAMAEALAARLLDRRPGERAAVTARALGLTAVAVSVWAVLDPSSWRPAEGAVTAAWAPVAAVALAMLAVAALGPRLRPALAAAWAWGLSALLAALAAERAGLARGLLPELLLAWSLLALNGALAADELLPGSTRRRAGAGVRRPGLVPPIVLSPFALATALAIALAQGGPQRFGLLAIVAAAGWVVAALQLRVGTIGGAAFALGTLGAAACWSGWVGAHPWVAVPWAAGLVLLAALTDLVARRLPAGAAVAWASWTLPLLGAAGAAALAGLVLPFGDGRPSQVTQVAATWAGLGALAVAVALWRHRLGTARSGPGVLAVLGVAVTLAGAALAGSVWLAAALAWAMVVSALWARLRRQPGLRILSALLGAAALQAALAAARADADLWTMTDLAGGAMAALTALAIWRRRSRARWLPAIVVFAPVATVTALVVAVASGSEGLIVAALLVTGLQAGVAGLVTGSAWLRGAVPVLACTAWLVLAGRLAGGDPQWVTVPVAATALALVEVVRWQRRRSGRKVAQPALVGAELAAMAALAGPALWLAAAGQIADGVLALALGAGLLGWAVLTRVRRRALAGAGIVALGAFMLLTVPVTRVVPAVGGPVMWLAIAAAGLVLLLVASSIERGRATAQAAARRIDRLLTGWE